MTWQPKKKDETLSASALELFWEKYGTWISGAVVVVLAGYLIYTLVGRHYETKARTGLAELEKVQVDDPGAEMTLSRLALEYGDTRIGPAIQIKRAQALYRLGDYANAQKVLDGLRGNRTLTDVDRAQVDLTLAYVAQEQGHIEEARKAFKVVMDDGLYAAEAKHMLEVLDRAAPPQPEVSVTPAPALAK